MSPMIRKLIDRLPIVSSLGRLYLPILPKRSRRAARWGIIAGNVLLLVGIGAFIITNRSASQTVRSSNLNSAVSTASSLPNPLDQLSSAQIALNVAQMAKLPELTPIRNQADSDSLLLSIVPNDTTVLAKPQVVSTAARSKKDIIRYVTRAGDTISNLADRFNVSADSIRWSNSVGGDSLAEGVKLVIPPINGIVYKVKSGDTPVSLARKFRADEGQIIAVNDAEISGLRPGELIVIPNGRIEVVAPSYSTVGFSSFSARYGGNGYDYGYCTWYVASKIAVPNNWGNANTWDNYAALSGWTVSRVPRVGAIAQSDRGWAGHVAIVHAVSADKTMIKYSDMNGLAGWGRVGYSDWVPVSRYDHYIYH